MKRALALLAPTLVGLLGTGCLVVPAKKVSTKPLPNELGTATFATQKSVQLAARADAAKIYVHAIRLGTCSRPVYAVTEVTTERKAKFEVSDDPRGAIFGFLLAPVLIPVSAVVTGFRLAGEDATTDKKTRPLGTQHFECSQAAGEYALQLTLPDGGTLRTMTDAAGDATFELPDLDAYTGHVTVVGQGSEPKQIAYALPRPAITVAKEATQECSAKHGISGAIELKISINDKGRPTRLWVSAGDADYNKCIGMRLSGLKFPERMWDATVKLPITVAPRAASL